MNKFMRAMMATAVMAMFCFVGQAVAEITVASWGGAYTMSQQKAYGDTFSDSPLIGGKANFKGVDVKGQRRVISHKGGQLCQTPDSEVGQGGIEGGLADLMGAKELPAVVNDGAFFRAQTVQRLLVAQAIYYVVAETGLAAEAYVGIPDELAVHLPGRDQHGQFPNVLRQA